MPTARPSLRSAQERNRLVEDNLGLVEFIIDHVVPWARRVRGLDRDDLRQQGALGLMRAAELWDPARGKFSTIACWHVIQAIRRAAGDADLIHLPEHLAAGGDRPQAQAQLRPVRLPGDGDEEGGRGSHGLPDPGEGPDEQAARLDLAAAVQRRLDHLRRRDGLAVRLRLQGLSLRAAGEQMGVGKERVRQLEARGMKCLRGLLAGVAGA